MSSQDIVLLAEYNRRYLSFPMDRLEDTPASRATQRGIRGWIELFSIHDRIPSLRPHLRKHSILILLMAINVFLQMVCRFLKWSETCRAQRP